MTLKVIPRLQAFSSAIRRTFVQNLPDVKWQRARAVPRRQLGFLLYTRLYARAVLAIVTAHCVEVRSVCVCLSLCVFVSVSEFCWKRWTERAAFWHRCFFRFISHCVLLKIGYLIIRALPSSLWNFVVNFGLKISSPLHVDRFQLTSTDDRHHQFMTLLLQYFSGVTVTAGNRESFA